MSISSLDDLLERCRTDPGGRTKEEIASLLRLTDPGDMAALWRAADTVRREKVGSDIHLRGLLEISNYCRRNCHYCGLRWDNRAVSRYRLTPRTILDTVEALDRQGIRTVVLQSGEDPGWSVGQLARLIESIKGRYDMAVTLSIGRRPPEEWRILRDAGMNRYLLRHETACPTLYERFHPGDTLQDRIRALKELRALGVDIGSGNLIGLPGQTPEALAADLLLARALEVDMYGVGPFIPHPETPLSNVPAGSVQDTYKMIALARLILQDVHIPITTALCTLDPAARGRGWSRGGNVIMPNATPPDVRGHYEIYREKGVGHAALETTVESIRGEIHAMGRSVSTSRGGSLKRSATS